MIYRYSKNGGPVSETSSIDVIFCFVQKVILEDNIWDYECEFHRFLNEDYGPSGLDIRDFYQRDGEFILADFDYADWLQEYYGNYYEAWLKDWINDYAESEANDFAYELKNTKAGQKVEDHGITAYVIEDSNDDED